MKGLSGVIMFLGEICLIETCTIWGKNKYEHLCCKHTLVTHVSGEYSFKSALPQPLPALDSLYLPFDWQTWILVAFSAAYTTLALILLSHTTEAKITFD